MIARTLAILSALSALASLSLAQTKTILGKLGQTTAAARIYAKPSSSARTYYRAKAYEYLVLKPYKNASWYRVLLQNGTDGYISSNNVAELPYQVTMPTNSMPANSNPHGYAGTGAETSSPSSRSSVAQYALNFLGTPYKWGGENLQSGIDCSGFMQKMLGKIGVNLPRTADEQSRVGMKITRLEDLQAGDRLYFWSTKRGMVGHTGMYLGNGYFVHASSGHGKIATDYLGTKYWLHMLCDARR